MNRDQTCVYAVVEGCDQPVLAVGKCRRHYWRDYKRSKGAAPDKRGRQPLDDVIYKLRFRLPGGVSHTVHYSDPQRALSVAMEQAERGQLVFFARYKMEERIT